jgi:phosphoribosylaminoimidazole-succinocarboxamide synthase
VARGLNAAGVPSAFISRLAPDTYLAQYASSRPCEVIVENVARAPVARFELEHGYEPGAVKALALSASELLREWLRPAELLDVRFVVCRGSDGRPTITSEISPDRMRLRVSD